MIEIVTGNLLEANVDALVNPVNTVGVMGKGLALAFKRAFPTNYVAYRAAAKSGALAIGRMFVVELSDEARPRFVINFPTKLHFRSPSRLEYLEEGLLDLVRTIDDRSIRSIAVPALGAGLGGLRWSDVRPLTERVLGALRGVEVLLFAPLE